MDREQECLDAVWLKHVPVKISPLASLAIAVAAAMAFV